MTNYSNRSAARNVKIIILLFFFLGLTNFLFADRSPDLTLAKELMNEGLYELAYDEFIDFAVKNGDSPKVAEAYYFASDCLFLQGNYSAALSKYKDYIRKFPFEKFTVFAKERLGEVYLKLADYENAEKTFIAFLKNYPDNEKTEDALYWLGETYYAKKESKKAEYYYKLCIKKYPKGKFYDYALYSTGYCLDNEGQYDEAEGYYKTLIDSFPKSSVTEDAYIAIGEIKVKENKPDEALKVFANYRKRYPHGRLYDKSLFLTGKLLKKENKTSLAVSTFHRLIEKFPDSEYRDFAYYYIGWIYFEGKNYPEALKNFSLIKKGSKLYFAAFYWSAITLEKMGKREKAIVRYRELASQNSAGGFQKDAIYELARIAYEDKNTPEGDSLVSSLANTDRKWKALMLKGDRFFLDGKYNDAIMLYEQIVLGGEGGILADVLYKLSSALFKKENYAEAEKYLKKYLSDYPHAKNRKEALLLFAETAYKNNRYEDALIRYKNVVKEFPHTDEAKLAILGEGWSLSKLGRDKEAYKILKKAQAVEKKKDFIVLGDAAYNAGNFNEAIANYRKALQEQGRREIALLKIGNTYFRIKQYEKAINTYNVLVKDFPMGDFAPNAFLKKAEALRKLGKYKKSNEVLKSLRKLYPTCELIARSFLISGDNYFDIGAFSDAKTSYQKVVSMLELPKDTFAIVPIGGIMKCIQKMDGEKRAAKFADTYIKRFSGTYLGEKIKMLKADMYYYAGKIKQAEAGYNEVLENRLKPKALYYQAKCLQSLGENAKAENRLKMILNLFPDSKIASNASLLLAKLLFEDKEYSRSLKLLEGYKQLNSDEDFEIAIIKAKLYLKLNYKNKAVEILKNVKDRTKGKWKAQALLLLGQIMTVDQKLNDALSFYDEAIETGVEELVPEAYFMKGKILKKQGKSKDALKIFLMIKYNLPESSYKTRALFEAAEITMELGKTQDAISLYKQVIERNDDKKLTAQAKDRLRTLNP